MAKTVGYLILLLIVFYFSAFKLFAQQPRYAECDKCGYCIGKTAPENWTECAKCLYPTPNIVATDNKTIEIITNPSDPRLDPAKKALNQPVPPAKGKYFTQLGCIDTSLTSFSDPGAVGGVLNFLLTKLIFPTAGVLAFIFLLYGAFLLVTAQGAEEQIGRGKRYVAGSIVGLIFTFSIVLIINVIGGTILRIPGLNKGTKITFIGWGQPTNGSGVTIYPNMSIVFNGEALGSIEALQGTQSQPETQIIYLSKKINVADPAELQAVEFVFTNDYCFSCIPQPGGDRNINNFRIMFDDKVCKTRRSEYFHTHGGGQVDYADQEWLPHNWGPRSGVNYSITCIELSP